MPSEAEIRYISEYMAASKYSDWGYSHEAVFSDAGDAGFAGNYGITNVNRPLRSACSSAAVVERDQTATVQVLTCVCPEM